MIHYHIAFRFSAMPGGIRFLGEVILPAAMKLVSVKLDEPDLRVMALRVRRGDKFIVSPVADGVPARELVFMHFGFGLLEKDRIELVVESVSGHNLSAGPHGYITLSGPFGLVIPGAM